MVDGIDALFIFLIVADVIVLMLAFIEAWLLHRHGENILKELAKRDVSIGTEVGVVILSWFFYKNPYIFVGIRLFGRVIETYGMAMFLKYLTSIQKKEN